MYQCWQNDLWYILPLTHKPSDSRISENQSFCHSCTAAVTLTPSNLQRFCHTHNSTDVPWARYNTLEPRPFASALLTPHAGVCLRRATAGSVIPACLLPTCWIRMEKVNETCCGFSASVLPSLSLKGMSSFTHPHHVANTFQFMWNTN